MTQIYVHIKNDIGYFLKRYGLFLGFLLIKTILDATISNKREKSTILTV